MGARLMGKTAIITGAGSGLGRETAMLFAQEGARVMVADIDLEKAHPIEEEITRAGGVAKSFKSDVSQESDVRQLVRATVESWGNLTTLVNNAGVGGAGHSVENTSLSEWEHTIGINLKGAFLCSKHSLPHMKLGGGAIVNVGSISSLVGLPLQGAYAPSKGGLIMLTRQMAIENAREGVRVNCVCPGGMHTPMFEKDKASQPDPEAWFKMVEESVPLGRIAKPIEVAYAILFLASDESSFITGACLPVDGGWTAR